MKQCSSFAYVTQNQQCIVCFFLSSDRIENFDSATIVLQFLHSQQSDFKLNNTLFYFRYNFDCFHFFLRPNFIYQVLSSEVCFVLPKWTFFDLIGKKFSRPPRHCLQLTSQTVQKPFSLLAIIMQFFLLSAISHINIQARAWIQGRECACN